MAAWWRRPKSPTQVKSRAKRSCSFTSARSSQIERAPKKLKAFTKGSLAPGTPIAIRYDEGAEVGYRWYAQNNHEPLFAFSHGLSYTTFTYRDLKVDGGETITASFTVTNSGQRAGADVPQVYLIDAPDGKRMRLLGFERVALEPGESRQVTPTADPRLLARFDGAEQRWRIDDGEYAVALSRAADAPVERATARLEGRVFGH